MNYYIADMHIGHANVIKHDRRPFADTEEMSRVMIQCWNNIVTPDDDVFILGDFAWKNAEGEKVLSQLVGRKYLILGNHDKPTEKMRVHFEWIKEYAVVDDNGTQVVLCHYPIAHWYNQYRGAVHLYGHIHNTKDNVAFERYHDICREFEIPFECYNVGCMMPYMDYAPRTLEHIRNANKNTFELRYPKYSRGDIVSFEVNNTMYEGTIEIVDAHGIFGKNDQPYYDILVDAETPTLFKHIPENGIVKRNK